MIQKTKYHSYCIGNLPKGCQYCVRGEKMVLFLTGICPRNCFFCPLSEQKHQKDVTFANERPVDSFRDIKAEAKLMQAKGAGITGGDPLTKLERTREYIKKMKKEFGKNFHLHLYTSLDLVDEKKLKQLYRAGLDEIRFHLDIGAPDLWDKILLAREFDWKIGVEIPIIPNKKKQLKRLVDFIQDKVDFLNLNELELADTSVSQLRKLGFKPVDRLSYAVKDSLAVGRQILAYINKNYSIQTHLCTVRLKDAVQLSERVKRESKRSKLPFDLVDEEGLLTRGAVYLPELAPSFSYQQKLNEVSAPQKIKKLEHLVSKLKKDTGIKNLVVDRLKFRLLLSKADVKRYAGHFKKFGLKPAIVKEYPTYDQLEVELEFL